MPSTVAEVLALVRAQLPEADPIEWPNSRLLKFIDDEHKQWAAKLGMLPGPGWFTVQRSFTLPANTTEYDLTDLFTAEEGQFAAVKVLHYLPPSGPAVKVPTVAPGQEQDVQLNVGATAVGQTAPTGRYLTRPAGVPTLNLHPESNVARNFRGLFRYEPPALTTDGDLQTDTRHDDVLVMGAVLRALRDQAEDDPTLQRNYMDLQEQFINAERNSAGESESETTKVTESDALFGGL